MNIYEAVVHPIAALSTVIARRRLQAPDWTRP